jgi:exosome complex component RRP42|eukprot:Stramenopile-MAST_4_protein_3653
MTSTYRISTGEKAYILDGVKQNVREDGRGRFDTCTTRVETGYLLHVHGSARWTTLHNGTDVVVSVKASFDTPKHTTPDEGNISCNVTCREGLPDTLSAAVLTRRLQRIFSIPEFLKDLCISESKYCWLLNIDVAIISYNGSALDNIVQATHAALNNVKLPKVSVITGDGGLHILDVNDDPTVFTRLNTSVLPVSTSLWLLGGVPIIDTTTKEEMCSEASINLSMDRQQSICGLHMSGTHAVDPKVIKLCINAAGNITKGIFDSFNRTLVEEEKGNKRHDIVSEEEAQAAGFNFL